MTNLWSGKDRQKLFCKWQKKNKKQDENYSINKVIIALLIKIDVFAGGLKGQKVEFRWISARISRIHEESFEFFECWSEKMKSFKITTGSLKLFPKKIQIPKKINF